MRTYDAGGTVSAAVEIFSKHLKDLFLAALIPVAVVAVAGVLIGVAAVSGSVALVAVLGLATLVLAVVASAIATATCFGIVDAAYNGQQTTLKESIDFAVTRLGAVIAASILVGLAIMAGALLCLLPGIFLAIAFSITMPALLVEGLGSTQAMGRSFDLVKGRWWATLGRLLIAYIIIFVPNMIVGAISGGMGDSGWIADLVLGIPVSALTTGFMAAVVVIVYYDLRARKEGTGLTAFPPAPPVGSPGQPQAPAVPPPADSVAPPGAGWSAPEPAAPQVPVAPPPSTSEPAPPLPPAAPPAAPAAPPPPSDPGTSASTGSLWSAGDPLQPPAPQAPPWEPPGAQPPSGDQPSVEPPDDSTDPPGSA